MPYQKSIKVLIVDDLPENLLALKKVIEQDDRIIYQASSGQIALELLLEHEFALAILDVMMPDMNGFELAELMRGTEKTRDIPIVFVSAAGKELNYAFKGYESGAVDFLHKPLDIYAVKSKVNVFASLFQQRNELKRQLEALEKSQRELHETQVELERALQMRDDFMSLVAHELRTPLNTLHVEAQLRQLLLDKGDCSAFTSDKVRGMVARDSRQINNMIRLISDMADISRIQSGHLSIRPVEVNLSELVRRITDDLAQQAKATGCDFTLQIEQGICGMWDEFRIEQVIINLLTNALRYGKGKPVNVIVFSDGDLASISVSDQGIGIAATEQERIFEKFERVGVNVVREGLGLGLYIARQLAEAHKGALRVNSVLGEGSTFILSLPLCKVETSQNSQISANGLYEAGI